MNSLDGGVFLSQLIYWSDHSMRSDRFFYKSAKEWHDEIYISKHQIDKHTKKLEELEILEIKKIKANGSPTLHYKINIERLNTCIYSFFKNLEMENENFINGNSKNDKSISENLEMEIQKIENENINISNSISKNQQNDFEKIENGNSKNEKSLTKITTKTTQKNTTDITTKDFNNDYKTKKPTKTTDRDIDIPSISNIHDREATQANEATTKTQFIEELSSKDVGLSVPSSHVDSLTEKITTPISNDDERIEHLVKSYEFADFGEIDNEAYMTLRFIAKRNKDTRLIGEAVNRVSQQDALEQKPYNEITGVLADWKSKGIHSLEQLQEHERRSKQTESA